MAAACTGFLLGEASRGARMQTQERNTGTTYKDKLIECQDCGKDFILEAGEQYFLAKKQYPETKRCPECRRLRRLAIRGDDGAVT